MICRQYSAAQAKNWLWVIAAGLLASGVAQKVGAQQVPDARVGAYAEPDGSAFVSQQVRYFVEVSTDSFFREAPVFPDLQIEGAIVLAPSGFGANFTRTVDGKTYAGQRRSYVIFPQRSGELLIPALNITLTVAQGPADSRSFDLVTEPLVLGVVMPEGADQVGEFVSTPRLDVSESFDRSFDNLKVGDALVRSITISAEDTLALVLPTLSLTAPDGIAIYAATPKLTETTNRGSNTGTRVESATYVLERPGEYVLAPIEVKWWNTTTESMQTETLPEVSLAVARAVLPGVRSAPVIDESPGVSPLMTFARRVLDWFVAHAVGISVSVAIAYLGWLVWRRFAAPVAAWVALRGQRRRESEGYLFGVFAKICQSGEAAAATAAFWRWYARAYAGDDAPAGGFAAIWGDLAAARYGPAANESRLDTSQLLKAARAWRSARRRARKAAPPAYATTLNPGRVHRPG